VGAERELAFVTRAIAMKSSNLARRLAPTEMPPREEQPVPAGTGAAAPPDALAVTDLPRRPRSSFAFRSIVIRDHGSRLFRIF
jgi:hypothetical protein